MRIHHITIAFLSLTFTLLAACSTSRSASDNEKAAQGNAIDPAWQARAAFLEANKEKILGNYDEAIRLFRESLRLKSHNAAARYELARLLRLKNLPREAMVEAKEAVKLDPENEWYTLFLAELQGNLRQHSDQVKTYGELVRKHPGEEDYHHMLARAQKQANLPDDAIRTYEEIERRFGLNEEVAIEIYSLYLRRKKTDKAVAVIERLIKAYPWEVKYKTILADTYMEAGDLTKAGSVLEQAMQQTPDDPYLRLSRASLFDKQGKQEEAKKELLAAFLHPDLDLASKLDILRSTLIMNQLFPENKTDISTMTKSLRESYPDDPQVLALLADVMISSELFEEARETLKQLITIDSSIYEAWEQLLRLDARADDRKAMMHHASRAMDLFPNMPLLYFFKGMAQFQEKQHAAAARTLESGLKMVVGQDDLKADFHAFLGDIYQELKDYAASVRAYEASLRLKPDNANVLNNYSYYLSLRSEDLEKAALMAGKANELDPGRSSYEDTYGWVLYKQGKYEEALVWIEKALQNGGNTSAVILEHYGDVLFKLGRKTEALEYWKRAANQGEGSDLLKKKIDHGELFE